MFNDSRSSCLLQVLTEYIIVSVTSAVTVTIAGVVKDQAMTIFGYYNMCHFYNHICWELTNWTRHWLSTLSRCLTVNISWDPILEVSNQNPVSISLINGMLLGYCKYNVISLQADNMYMKLYSVVMIYHWCLSYGSWENWFLSFLLHVCYGMSSNWYSKIIYDLGGVIGMFY